MDVCACESTQRTNSPLLCIRRASDDLISQIRDHIRKSKAESISNREHRKAECEQKFRRSFQKPFKSQVLRFHSTNCFRHLHSLPRKSLSGFLYAFSSFIQFPLLALPASCGQFDIAYVFIAPIKYQRRMLVERKDVTAWQ